MRITLKLDHDLAAALKRLRKGRDTSYRELVDEAVRLGIKEMSARPSSRPDFQTRSVSLGRLRILSIDNVSEALAMV